MINDKTFPPILLEDERLDEVNANIRLIQKKHGLTYGTDAFLLAAYAPKRPTDRAVDLGSGTGILPLLLVAGEKIGQITAVEIQEEFCDLIERNAALNRMDGRITPLCADLRTLTPACLGGEVDLVLSNPPYMLRDAGKRNLADAKYLARHEVCGTIFDFCTTAARILRYGGKFLVVWRPDRLADLFVALRSSGLEPKRMTPVASDPTSEPSMVLVEAIRGGAPSMRISRTLFLNAPPTPDGTRLRTADAEEIYRSGSFEQFLSHR